MALPPTREWAGIRAQVIMKSNKGVLLFRTQLSLALLPIIVLPLSIIGYVSYYVSYHALQDRSIASVSQISSLASQNLDNTLQQIIQLAKAPLYDQHFQQIITYYSQHPELDAHNINLQDMRTLTNFTLNILIHNDDIASIDIYTTGKAVFSETLFYGLKPIANWTSQPWFPELMHTPTRTRILPAHILQSDFGNRRVFSVAQAIVNTSTFQPVGAIVINVDMLAIERTLAASAQKADTIFLIYGPIMGQDVYVTPGDVVRDKRELDTLRYSAEQTLRQGKNQFTWNNTSYFLSSSTSSLPNLTLATVATLVPSSVLTQDIDAITLITVLMILVTLFLALGIMLFLISRFSKQITQLRYLMMQVETGNLDVRFQTRGKGEITVLGKSFNHMVARLKQLIQDNYESQLQRKKAELAALQSQINPHFLYNTLGSFQMIALTENQERLAHMAYELGQLMRYSLDTDTLVDLGQQLAHAQHFLSLMKERYEERLHFAIQVSEALYSYKLPKFTLQPLIENAIYHGIDPKVEGGTVLLHGREQDQQLVLEVSDDGVGMPDADLQRLQEALRYESNVLKRSRHIGILNVQGQIQRVFGSQYGLVITRGDHCGTKVTLRLPLCKQDELIEEQL